MRKYIDIFLLGLVVVAGSYLVYTHPAQAKHILLVIEGRSAPCASVVTYSIGTIDPRFGISKETLLSDIATAAMIWEDTSKKTLFRYQESGGDVTINLTYDRRQAATDKLTSIDTQSTQGKASYDALKARYDVLYTSIQREQADVTSQGRSYKQDEASFNQSVALWNSRGGAPPSVYTQLQTQKEALAQQYRDSTV
jgi:hypothetical protein